MSSFRGVKRAHSLASSAAAPPPISVFDLARLLVQVLPSHTDCLHPTILEFVAEPSWTLSATSARERYVLTERDLAGLPHRLTSNPKNRRFAPMKLYKETDLYRLALRKYKSAIGFEAAYNKRQKRSEAGRKAAETKRRRLEDGRQLRR